MLLPTPHPLLAIAAILALSPSTTTTTTTTPTTTTHDHQDPTLQALQRETDRSLLWGTYRPNLYFGLRPRLPHSLMTGMLWFGTQDFQSFARKLQPILLFIRRYPDLPQIISQGHVTPANNPTNSVATASINTMAGTSHPTT
jgi:hypothetical protein